MMRMLGLYTTCELNSTKNVAVKLLMIKRGIDSGGLGLGGIKDKEPSKCITRFEGSFEHTLQTSSYPHY